MSRAFGYHAFGGPEVQQYFDRPDPKPADNEILIRVRAAGVARLDHLLRDGAVPALNGHVPFPQVMGMEAAGDVLAVGAGVTDLKVGDAVFGFALSGAGTYAETTVLPAENAARKPESLPYEWAATVPVSGTTALDGLDRLDLPAGSTLLINGVGGSTGLATAQLARARGLTVIGTGSDSKRAVAEALGVTFASYTAGDIPGQVRALAPSGVDGLFDLVGGDSLRSVAGLVKDAKYLLSAADYTVSELGGEFVDRRLGRTSLEAVAALMVDGTIDPHITRTFTFDQSAEAVAAVETGHTTGKLVIALG
ncbi:NADP-dependent oxidoreductase [Micromonospora profundi]|uniref:NADP-dependent oxidoreductase n=1 Tax=Micromonospora TaxID=1873 RepID=UPI0006AE4CD7|nr:MULTISPECIES: NADP-dependent oxidoreductase [Micromonospora]KOX02777.1 NADPH:quinone reductase [Micromonospora sp. NRRL B-16802]NJC12029.1 NADPH:quinone reductase-like Zn-dependent oxidoreductase [Micromonospora profundi]